jgi:glycosyltransferase involved in cell wall biosynthesis
MILKKNILFITSWLDLDKGTGSFFIEQALILKRDYNIFLVHFSPYKFNKSKLLKGKFISIEKKIYNSELEIYFVNYPLIKMFENFISKLAIKKMFNFFKHEKKKIDICHAHSIFEAGFWAYRINQFYSIPYIITEHNQLTLKKVGRKKLRIFSLLLERAERRIVVSNDLIRQFASNGFFLEFDIIGNTFDQNVFNFESKDEFKGINIVTIGAFTEVKDFETLLKSLKIVDDSYNKSIEFIWIGYNSWGIDVSDKVEMLIESFNFKNINFQLFSKMDKFEIANVFKKSSFFVSSSICETFGLSILEAISCGLPVVVTQSGGINDFVNKMNGKIVPIKNEDLMAKAIIEMIDEQSKFDPKFISEEVVFKFGEEKFIEKYKQIYESIN